MIKITDSCITSKGHAEKGKIISLSKDEEQVIVHAGRGEFFDEKSSNDSSDDKKAKAIAEWENNTNENFRKKFPDVEKFLSAKGIA